MWTVETPVLRTFFVMMKLVPMATEPDIARRMPIYLSSTMAGRSIERGKERREWLARRREWGKRYRTLLYSATKAVGTPGVLLWVLM